MANDETPLNEITSKEELWARYQRSILRGIRPLFALEFVLGALGGWYVGRLHTFNVLAVLGAIISIAAGVILGAVFYNGNMVPWRGSNSDEVPRPRK